MDWLVGLVVVFACLALMLVAAFHLLRCLPFRPLHFLPYLLHLTCLVIGLAAFETLHLLHLHFLYHSFYSCYYACLLPCPCPYQGTRFFAQSLLSPRIYHLGSSFHRHHTLLLPLPPLVLHQAIG